MGVVNTNYGQYGNKSIPSYFGIGGSFCPEAKRIFNKWESLGVPASDIRKTQINNIIQEQINNKNWYNLDSLFVWTAHSKVAALVDWKNPDRVASIILDYGGSFVTDGYFQSNSSCIINTNFNPGDGGKYNFQRNNNRFGTYRMRHDSNANLVDLSALDANGRGSEIFYLANGAYQCNWNNSSTYTAIQYCTEAGLSVCSRRNPNEFEFEHDGYSFPGNTTFPPKITGSAGYAVTFPNTPFILGGRSTNGVYTLKSTGRHGYTFFGGYDVDAWLLHDSINRNLYVPLGVNLQNRLSFLGNSMTSNAANYIPRTVANLGYDFAVNWAGVPGYTLSQVSSLFDTQMTKYRTNAYRNDIITITELTNTMAGNGSNATQTYNELLALCQKVRPYFNRIIVTTMLPRNSAQINNANRQNDANLTDNATLNGMIRNTALSSSTWDGVADWGANLTMGIYSNGVAGVGEKNTTYYTADEVHPNATGYNLLADTYNSPTITSLLI